MYGDSMYIVKRQLICSLVGFVLFAAFLFIDIKIVKKLVAVVVIGSIILCILTYIPGLSIEKMVPDVGLKCLEIFLFSLLNC